MTLGSAMKYIQRSEILKRLGKNVRAFRYKLGISQERLALIAELDRTYVGAIERGERNVSIVNLVKLARALECRTEKLTEGIDADRR